MTGEGRKGDTPRELAVTTCALALVPNRVEGQIRALRGQIHNVEGWIRGDGGGWGPGSVAEGMATGELLLAVERMAIGTGGCCTRNVGGRRRWMPPLEAVAVGGAEEAEPPRRPLAAESVERCEVEASRGAPAVWRRPLPAAAAGFPCWLAQRTGEGVAWRRAQEMGRVEKRGVVRRG